MSHKKAAVEALVQNMRWNRDIFGVHETLQMSALQMLTCGIPSMETQMSDLYVNMHLTKSTYLSAFLSFVSFPTTFYRAEMILLEARILHNSN